MNLIIEDGINKKYHPFIHCTETQALFVMNNINKINAKNNTYLTVYENIDLEIFEKKDYKMDQGMFEKLIIQYNFDLKEDEKPLSFWTRD